MVTPESMEYKKRFISAFVGDSSPTKIPKPKDLGQNPRFSFTLPTPKQVQKVHLSTGAAIPSDEENNADSPRRSADAKPRPHGEYRLVACKDSNALTPGNSYRESGTEPLHRKTIEGVDSKPCERGKAVPPPDRGASSTVPPPIPARNPFSVPSPAARHEEPIPLRLRVIQSPPAFVAADAAAAHTPQARQVTAPPRGLPKHSPGSTRQS